MPDDIINHLNAACVGHRHAHIPWPHRLLHDAVAEIVALRAERDALRDALRDAAEERR